MSIETVGEISGATNFIYKYRTIQEVSGLNFVFLPTN